MVFSYRYGEGTSHMRILWPISGKMDNRRRKSESLSCFCHFLKLLQLKIFSMPRCHIWGSCVINHINCVWNQTKLEKDFQKLPAKNFLWTQNGLWFSSISKDRLKSTTDFKIHYKFRLTTLREHSGVDSESDMIMSPSSLSVKDFKAEIG